METRPFEIQAPESIAKEYGGNKQKIAQAMQMGLVDPTAGLLAGMFIDRMRSAQMQEMAPQPTIAQQVMGGAPPASPQPPMTPPQAGLGALPAGAAPNMGAMAMPPAPPAPPPEAPASVEPGMAEGGIAQLPVPDAMFDEPDNGGYGGGGLVAFAGGGTEGPMGPWFEAEVKRLFPGAVISGRARTPDRNRQVGGVSNSYHLTNDALDVKPPPGMSFTEFGTALRRHFGPSIDTIFNTKNHYDHVHLEPGPGRGRSKPVPRGWERLPSEAPAGLAALSSPMDTPEGRKRSFLSQLQMGKEVYGALPDQGLKEDEAYYRKQLGPDEQRKQRKEDMWYTLAQIGASMAGTKSPHFLQAVGEALSTALPGAAASRKERREAERDARKGLRETLGLRRAEQEKVISFAKDMQEAELDAERNELDRALRANLTRMELASRESIASADRAAQKEIAGMRPANPSDLEIAMSILGPNGTAEQKAALEKYLQLKRPPQVNPLDPNNFGMGAAAAGAPQGAQPINVGGWDD